MKQKENRVTVGGQAVVEGVMMRGPKAIATAVRKQDGSIVYKKRILTENNNKWVKIPFIRGIISLYDAMFIGTSELIFASNQAGLEEEELTDKQIGFTILTSVLISIAIFMWLPSAVGGFLFPANVVAANLVEAVIKLVLFLGYIFGISFLKDIKRVFEYHGAEHKSIMNYEMEKELTPKNAKVCTRFHPRCGTSFLLLVMLVSIIVFSLVDFILPMPKGNHLFMLLYKLATRVLFVPFVAGISYEFQRWSSFHLDNIFAKMIAIPGMWLQKITNREPVESQLEVARVAIKVSLGEEVDNATEVFVEKK